MTKLDETRAATVCRNGRILLAVLIEHSGHRQFIVRREDTKEFLLAAPTLMDAQRYADMYLDGYAAGYDDAKAGEK